MGTLTWFWVGYQDPKAIAILLGANAILVGVFYTIQARIESISGTFVNLVIASIAIFFGPGILLDLLVT